MTARLLPRLDQPGPVRRELLQDVPNLLVVEMDACCDQAQQHAVLELLGWDAFAGFQAGSDAAGVRLLDRCSTFHDGRPLSTSLAAGLYRRKDEPEMNLGMALSRHEPPQGPRESGGLAVRATHLRFLRKSVEVGSALEAARRRKAATGLDPCARSGLPRSRMARRLAWRSSLSIGGVEKDRVQRRLASR